MITRGTLISETSFFVFHRRHPVAKNPTYPNRWLNVLFLYAGFPLKQSIGWRCRASKLMKDVSVAQIFERFKSSEATEILRGKTGGSSSFFRKCYQRDHHCRMVFFTRFNNGLERLSVMVSRSSLPRKLKKNIRSILDFSMHFDYLLLFTM